jgi:hypothetical protein
MFKNFCFIYVVIFLNSCTLQILQSTFFCVILFSNFLLSPLILAVFVLFRAPTCYSVCVVSCRDVLQWLLCRTHYSVLCCAQMCYSVLCRALACSNVCIVSCRAIMFVLCRVLACCIVCVVSCLEVFKCLCCVVPSRVTMFVSCSSLACSNVVLSHSFWKIINFFQWSLNLASLL